MKYVKLEIVSKGCASCIRTSITHLLRIPGVRGAKVVGREVIVIVDDNADVQAIASNAELLRYYTIKSWRVLDTSDTN